MRHNPFNRYLAVNGLRSQRKLKWLQAAADGIVECIKKSIEDLDMDDVEKHIGTDLKRRRATIE